MNLLSLLTAWMKDPHLLQAVSGFVVLVTGVVGWYMGKNLADLVPFLGAVMAYTEFKKFSDKP